MTSSPPMIECHTGFFPPNPVELNQEMEILQNDLGARYQIESFIAQGGFATVWSARDTIENTHFAIKKLDARPTRKGDFFRELRAMFRLDHPSIVRIVNFREVENRRYLILELCKGGSLRMMISRARQASMILPERRIARLVGQIASALASAHQCGLTHRDIKPENLLFAEQDGEGIGQSRIKIADFGLACVRPPADDGRLRAVTGSPAYMAPEQFCGRFSAASDVYALGVVAYELWTNDIPFHGMPSELGYKHLREKPAIPDRVPSDWQQLILRMLSKTEDDRPTAEEVVKTISGLIAEPSKSKSTTSTQASSRKLKLSHDLSISASYVWSVSCGFAIGDTHKSRIIDHHGHILWSIDEPILAVDGNRIATRSSLWCQPHEDHLGDVIPLQKQVEWPEKYDTLSLCETGFAAGLKNQIRFYDYGGRKCWDYQSPPSVNAFRLACLHDGTVAYASIGDRSKLTFLDPSGNPCDELELPGIVWAMYGHLDSVICRVLTGEGFRLYLAKPKTELVRVKGSRGLTAFSGPSNREGSANEIFGLWEQGRLVMWSSPRHGQEYQMESNTRGRFQQLAVSQDWIVSLKSGSKSTLHWYRRP